MTIDIYCFYDTETEMFMKLRTIMKYGSGSRKQLNFGDYENNQENGLLIFYDDHSHKGQKYMDNLLRVNSPVYQLSLVAVPIDDTLNYPYLSRALPFPDFSRALPFKEFCIDVVGMTHVEYKEMIWENSTDETQIEVLGKICE